MTWFLKYGFFRFLTASELFGAFVRCLLVPGLLSKEVLAFPLQRAVSACDFSLWNLAIRFRLLHTFASVRGLNSFPDLSNALDFGRFLT